MLAGRDLGAVNGAGRGVARACGCAFNAKWLLLLLSCCLPLGKNVWTTSEKRQQAKKECALLQSAARIQINGAQWECGGRGVRHVQHACTTDTRAHVPHLFDGNLHALDSHQRQTVSASVPLRPTHNPTPPLLLSLCLSFF